MSARLSFHLKHTLLPLALALVALLVFERTDLDGRIEDLFWDRASGEFPLRHVWYVEEGVHTGLKVLLILFAAALLAVLVGSFWKRAWAPWRRALVYVLLCLGLGPAVIGGMKSVSPRHCPWDVQRYGGSAPEAKLFDPPAQGVKQGRCFPCGGASGGFALVSVYFALRARHPRWARRALWVGFAFGGVMGVGRMVQGAHFLSHVLASAWVCWMISLGLYLVLLRRTDEPG